MLLQRRLDVPGSVVFGMLHSVAWSFYLRLTAHATRSPESPLYLEYDSEDDSDLSEAESLEMDDMYKRTSLELVRTACCPPIDVELVSSLVFLCHDHS